MIGLRGWVPIPVNNGDEGVEELEGQCLFVVSASCNLMTPVAQCC